MSQPAVKQSLTVVQITDCHLQNDPTQLYRGYDVEAQLEQVLRQALEHQPDLLLWTGDLIHHGGPQGYQRLQQRLAALPVPSYWIPGNHDDAELMQQIGGEMNLRTVQQDGWVIVLLDSSSLPDGRGSGSLDRSELEFLESQLQDYSDQPVLVVIHHNPVPVNSGWQDPIMLANADDFWQVVEKTDNVQAVICGHVHQQWALKRGDVDIFTTPSSSVQFKPCSDEFLLEDRPEFSSPGFRVLELTDSGHINTQVVYI